MGLQRVGHDWVTFTSLHFFGIEGKTDLLQSCGHCWVFQICWHIECRTFTASSFRIWNSSVQFSHSVMSNSLWPHEPHYTRPPCPSPTPRVHSDSCPLSWWCHPTTSSSVIPFSSCPQSFPASGSFQMSQLFTSGGQSIGVSASTSVLSMNSQEWSPLGWNDWISSFQ